MSSIECDQFIARPPAAVWRALTEPELLAGYHDHLAAGAGRHRDPAVPDP